MGENEIKATIPLNHLSELVRKETALSALLRMIAARTSLDYFDDARLVLALSDGPRDTSLLDDVMALAESVGYDYLFEYRLETLQQARKIERKRAGKAATVESDSEESPFEEF